MPDALKAEIWVAVRAASCVLASAASDEVDRPFMAVVLKAAT